MSATLPGPGFQSVQQRGQENQDQAVGPSGIIPSDPKLIPETRDYASSFTFQHLSRRSWNEAGNAKIRPGKSSRWMKVGQDLPPPLRDGPVSQPWFEAGAAGEDGFPVLLSAFLTFRAQSSSDKKKKRAFCF